MALCTLCNKPFDQLNGNQKYCLHCASARVSTREALRGKKNRKLKKIEEELGKPVPTSPVEGWQDLIMEDLANTFNELTEEELCLHYGLNVRQYYEWKISIPDFMAQVNERSQKYKDAEGLYYRKLLVKRARISDNALAIGLNVTKQYARKGEEDPLEGLSERDKLVRIKQLMKKVE